MRGLLNFTSVTMTIFCFIGGTINAINQAKVTAALNNISKYYSGKSTFDIWTFLGWFLGAILVGLFVLAFSRVLINVYDDLQTTKFFVTIMKNNAEKR